MDTRFSGKAALVTGTASGIGRETALRLAAEGAEVFCTDVAEEGLNATVADISEAGGKAIGSLCDVSDPDACKAAVAAAVAAFGKLDLLANIAGIAIFDHCTELSVEQWSRVLAINLSGTFFMSQAAVPHLLDSGGNIVNMASSAGLAGMAYGAAYCASKGGVVLLTKSMGVELAHRGVRVNCICPGGVATPLTINLRFPEDASPSLMERMRAPDTRFAQPAEIAALVAYLGSDEARHVNAAAVAIDAGQTA
ncbi:MAG: SDR family NAD(P)-dependent oxidoreductase [Deltaproteobacteria bacterium]